MSLLSSDMSFTPLHELYKAIILQLKIYKNFLKEVNLKEHNMKEKSFRKERKTEVSHLVMADKPNLLFRPIKKFCQNIKCIKLSFECMGILTLQ